MERLLANLNRKKAYNVYQEQSKKESENSLGSAGQFRERSSGKEVIPQCFSRYSLKVRKNALGRAESLSCKSELIPHSRSELNSPGVLGETSMYLRFFEKIKPQVKALQEAAKAQPRHLPRSQARKPDAPPALRAKNSILLGKVLGRAPLGAERTKLEKKSHNSLEKRLFSRTKTPIGPSSTSSTALRALKQRIRAEPTVSALQMEASNHPLLRAQKRRTTPSSSLSKEEKSCHKSSFGLLALSQDRLTFAVELSNRRSPPGDEHASEGSPSVATPQFRPTLPRADNLPSIHDVAAVDLELAEYPAFSNQKTPLQEDIVMAFPASSQKPSHADTITENTPVKHPTSAFKFDGSSRLEIAETVSQDEEEALREESFFLERTRRDPPMRPGGILSALIVDGEHNKKLELVARIRAHTADYGGVFPSSLQLYSIQRVIGEGSFGRVYLALSKLCGARVAIKAYEKRHVKDRDACKRVFDEIRNLAALAHSNVIRFVEVFEDQERILIVQEFAEGDSLAAQTFGEERLLALLREIVAGLSCLHAHRVLHRDLKPHNVMLGGGRAKICDLGLSVRVAEGDRLQEVIGTPGYMAPELYAREGYGGFQSDVWSLGVLCYFCLFGDLPFKGEHIEEIKARVTAQPLVLPARPSLSASLRELLTGMLQKDPDRRFSLAQVREALGLEDAVAARVSSPRLDSHTAESIAAYGFDPMQVVDSITNKRFNHITALYNMLQLSHAE